MPVGHAYILTATKKVGFAFDLVDIDIDDLPIEDLEVILRRDPADVYAPGRIVTGFRLVKTNIGPTQADKSKIGVVAGNSVATSMPKIFMRRTDIDICLIGERDITFIEVLKAIKCG